MTSAQTYWFNHSSSLFPSPCCALTGLSSDAPPDAATWLQLHSSYRENPPKASTRPMPQAAVGAGYGKAQANPSEGLGRASLGGGVVFQHNVWGGEPTSQEQVFCEGESRYSWTS